IFLTFMELPRTRASRTTTAGTDPGFRLASRGGDAERPRGPEVRRSASAHVDIRPESNADGGQIPEGATRVIALRVTDAGLPACGRYTLRACGYHVPGGFHGCPTLRRHRGRRSMRRLPAVDAPRREGI